MFKEQQPANIQEPDPTELRLLKGMEKIFSGLDERRVLVFKLHNDLLLTDTEETKLEKIKETFLLRCQALRHKNDHDQTFAKPDEIFLRHIASVKRGPTPERHYEVYRVFLRKITDQMNQKIELGLPLLPYEISLLLDIPSTLKSASLLSRSGRAFADEVTLSHKLSSSYLTKTEVKQAAKEMMSMLESAIAQLSGSSLRDASPSTSPSESQFKRMTALARDQGPFPYSKEEIYALLDYAITKIEPISVSNIGSGLELELAQIGLLYQLTVERCRQFTNEIRTKVSKRLSGLSLHLKDISLKAKEPNT